MVMGTRYPSKVLCVVSTTPPKTARVPRSHSARAGVRVASMLSRVAGVSGVKAPPNALVWMDDIVKAG